MRGPLLGKEQRIFMNGNAVGEMDSQLTKDQSLRTLFSEDPVGSAHFESSQRVLGSRDHQRSGGPSSLSTRTPADKHNFLMKLRMVRLYRAQLMKPLVHKIFNLQLLLE